MSNVKSGVSVYVNGKEIDYKAEYEKRVAREKRSYTRRAIKVSLILEKAKDAGITVSEDEVTREYNKRYGSK